MDQNYPGKTGFGRSRPALCGRSQQIERSRKLLNCALMGIRSLLAKPFAARIASETKKWSAAPGPSQQRIFSHLIEKAKDTAFGRDHGFSSIRNHDDFRRQVPVRDYEGLKPYMDRVIRGEE